MIENIINWKSEDGTEHNVPLDVLQSIYETTVPVRNLERRYHLQYVFHSTYSAAISSGLLVEKAIEKAAQAVALAGKYDEAMKQAVEARIRAEFPEPTHDPE